MKEVIKYGVDSEFNRKLHAETFINYLEVVIDSSGKIHYANPSHTIFMEKLLISKFGDKEFRDMAIRCEESWVDFLCRESGCIAVWNDFYIGKPNSKQKRALLSLKLMKYTYGGSPLYQGSL